MDLPELLDDATAPRLRLRTRAQLVHLRRLAGFADGGLSRGRTIPGGRRFGFGRRLRRQPTGTLHLDGSLRGNRLRHRLLLVAAQWVLNARSVPEDNATVEHAYQFGLQLGAGGDLFLQDFDPVRQIRRVVRLEEELRTARVHGGDPEDVFPLGVVFGHAYYAGSHVHAV